MMNWKYTIWALALLTSILVNAQAPTLVVPTGLNGSNLEKQLLSPKGDLLYTLNTYGEVKCFSTESGKELREFLNSGGARDFALSPDGTCLAIVGYNITTYNAINGVLLGQSSTTFGKVDRVSYLNNEQFVGLSYDGFTIVTYQNKTFSKKIVTYKELKKSSIHYGPIRLSPDGKSLAISNLNDNKLKVWSIAPTSQNFEAILKGTTQPKYEIMLNGIISSLEFSENSELLYTNVYIYEPNGGRHHDALIVDNKKGIQLKSYELKKYSFLMAIMNNGQLVLQSEGESLVASEFSSGKTVWTNYDYMNLSYGIPNVIAFGNYLYFNTYKGGAIQKAEVLTGKPIKSFVTGTPNTGKQMSLSGDKKTLAISNMKGQVTIWSIESGKQVMTIGETQTKRDISFIALSEFGKWILIQHSLNEGKYAAEVYDIDTKKIVWKSDAPLGKPCGIKDNRIFVCKDGFIEVIDFEHNEKVFSEKSNTDYGYFDLNENHLFYYDNDEKQLKRADLDNAKSKVIGGKDFVGAAMTGYSGGDIFVTGKYEELKITDMNGNSLKLHKKLKNKYFGSLAISPSGKRIAAGNLIGGAIYTYGGNNWDAEFDLSNAHLTEITGLQFANENVLLSSSRDKHIKLWNLGGQGPDGEFYLLEDDNWLFINSDGMFDGSEGAIKALYFVEGVNIIPLEQLFEKFYVPGLLAQMLSGTPPSPQSGLDIKKLKPAPKVRMTFDKARNLEVGDDTETIQWANEQIMVSVDATCPEDGVSEVRLYLNGKLVESTRNLEVTDDQHPASLKKQFVVQLSQGINELKTVAFNTQRTESPADKVNILLKSNNTTPSTNNGIQLHLLIIGVNQYKNPKYNLNYAEADALSLKNTLEDGGKRLFSKINTTLLSSEQASKSNIRQAMEQVKKAATSNDVFVFYFAGHGVVDNKQEFYLVPHDVLQLYGNDNALAQNGLSTNEMLQFSKELKAQKQLFILDACQSAGAVQQIVAMRGAVEEKAIAQLARSTGTHWLTASGSEQFASEFTQLGHGAFTYCLIEGMSGKADNGDKQITVKEIDAYLQANVPELTKKLKGTPQYPSSYGFGNDFPVGTTK